MNDETKPKKRGFFDIIKNLFWILLFLQFAPILFSNLKNTLEDAMTPKTQVGYLTISGIISDSRFYTKHIRKFLKAPDIKALLVKIDSPGGFPGSAQAIFQELKKFKEKKPVVAFIENIGASAAYNIAAASNYIVATPSSLVGSIGVWMQIPPAVNDLAESWKIKFRTIQSGKFKTAGSPFKAMTPEEQAYLQDVSDDSYNQFVNDIAKSRNLPLEESKAWADGKIFTGNQALALKLVDQLGSELDAIEELKKEALIEKDQELKFIHPTQPSLLKKFFAPEDESSEDQGTYASATADFITNVIQKVSIGLRA
jgi:protease IV